MKNYGKLILILITTILVGLFISWLLNGQNAFTNSQLVISISGSLLVFLALLLISSGLNKPSKS